MDLVRIYSERDISALEHKLLLHVLHAWRRKCVGRPFPARLDLTPRDLLPALSCLTICRVVEGGEDFEVRLVGNDILESYGGDFRGKRLSLLTRQIGFSMLDAYRILVNRGKPLLLSGSFEHIDAKLLQRDVLLLPLGAHGHTVDHVLGAGALLPSFGRPEFAPRIRRVSDSHADQQ